MVADGFKVTLENLLSQVLFQVRLYAAGKVLIIADQGYAIVAHHLSPEGKAKPERLCQLRHALEHDRSWKSAVYRQIK